MHQPAKKIPQMARRQANDNARPSRALYRVGRRRRPRPREGRGVGGSGGGDPSPGRRRRQWPRPREGGPPSRASLRRGGRATRRRGGGTTAGRERRGDTRKGVMGHLAGRRPCPRSCLIVELFALFLLIWALFNFVTSMPLGGVRRRATRQEQGGSGEEPSR